MFEVDEQDPQRQAINEGVRERSGSVDIDGRLVSFLYDLMRDRLPAGTVETMVRNVECEHGETREYSNGWLARHAEDLARRLTEEQS